MKGLTTFSSLALITGIGVIAGCGGGNSTAIRPQPISSAPIGGAQYIQIERLARPAIKEAFEAYQRHDQTNRSSPYADPILGQDIVSFMETVATRDTATSNALESILIPDEMTADLSQTATDGAYLGVETGGATGNKFGGRGLDNDVIAISLGAIFGNTLSALGVVPDDHKESPCLTNDNVAYDKTPNGTFPYLDPPK